MKHNMVVTIGPCGFPNPDKLNCRGVLLDLDDTLYDYEAAHAAALSAAYDICPISLSYEAFASQYREARNAVTQKLSPNASCRSPLIGFSIILREMACIGPPPLCVEARSYILGLLSACHEA